MRYDAFISYSHAADNVAAPALQRALHSFAKPWNRMRALYVFRDQTSLAASPELWPSIEAALSDARWLLLMASPESAASRWVGREIDWWLTHRSPQTLLIVLTGGAVYWDEAARDFDWQRTTCLPHDVVSKRFPGEPLWVDLSWAKSDDVLTLRHARFRQAVLDLAAPLHGRPKDELDGEDVRRFAQFQRIRTGVSVALAVLFVIAVIAFGIAYLQRNEALRQATIAHAGRLAAKAEQLRERGGPTDPSVMLGAEGLRLLAGIHERSADVDQSFRRALAGLFEQRASLEISANEFRLTPDGTRVVATDTGAGRVPLYGALDGKPRGCDYDALRRIRTTAAGERLMLIGAVSEDGAWCVLHVYFDGANRRALELWSAEPLRQVAHVTLSSRDGHLYPAVAPGGRWLVATDVPQTGGAAGSEVYLWSVGHDGVVGAPQTLPGMKAMRFAPDGRYLATSAGLWHLPERGSGAAPNDAAPRAERRAAWDAEPWKVAFSPDSAHVATQEGPDTKVVIWDVANGNDRLRASPPDGELLALAKEGRQIVVAGGNNSTVWDTELDLARAVLPVRADAAALPGRGEAIFIAPGDVSSGIRRQRVLALPEGPAALLATSFPGTADRVRSLRLASGVAVFLEVTDAGAERNRPAQRPGTDGSTIRVHRLDTRTAAWSIASAIEGVTAFELAPNGNTYAVTAGGQVMVVSNDGDAAAQRFSPQVAADRLAFSADGAYLLAFAPAADGGALHLWHRAKGEHWSVPMAGQPAAMAVTRDGRYVLAIAASGTATRAGSPFQLTRWRVADPADKAVLDLGRSTTPPRAVCAALSDGRKSDRAAGDKGIGVAAADIAGCSDAKPAPSGWRIEAGDNQATVYAPWGAAVARIDHAAKILQAVLSSDGREALTLDESGHVQRFATEPQELIAQACRRQPQALQDDLRASLPVEVRAVDACGRKPGVETTTQARQ